MTGEVAEKEPSRTTCCVRGERRSLIHEWVKQCASYSKVVQFLKQTGF